VMRLILYRGKYAAVDRSAGKRRRISLGTADRGAAERRLRDLESRFRAPATTTRDYYLAYKADRYEQLVGKETFDLAWRRLEPVLGHLRPDQITRQLTRDYARSEQKRGIGNSAIRRDLGVLAAILHHGLGQACPAIIELPPPPPPRDRQLTREEYVALREAARTTAHVHFFVVLAYRTAARTAAILDLTWDRVDLERRRIRLDNGEARRKGRATVPIGEDVAELLRQAQHGALTDHVIEYAGKPVGSIKKAFGRAVARANLEDVSPHILRHSAAVHMAEAGVPIEAIADFLGQKDIRVTKRVYARFSPDYLRRAAEALA
jgi:integrase